MAILVLEAIEYSSLRYQARDLQDVTACFEVHSEFFGPRVVSGCA
jgi:hypothetical protein